MELHFYLEMLLQLLFVLFCQLCLLRLKVLKQDLLLQLLLLLQLKRHKASWISASHCGHYAEFSLLGHNTKKFGKRSTDVAEEHIASILRVEK
jgi:hypothetical protein